MIAERAFGAHFVERDVAFENDFGVRGNFEGVGFALHHFHRLAAQKSREHHFVEIGRNRQHAGERRRWIGADRDGDGNFSVGIGGAGAAKMFGAVFLRLPVHAGGAFVVDLHAIHADVALPCFRIAREDERQRDEAAAVLRPAFENREIEKVDVAAACG